MRNTRNAVVGYALALAFVVGFFILFFPAIHLSCLGEPRPDYVSNPIGPALATISSSLVGGFIAVGLGLKPPAAEVGGTAAKPKKGRRSLLGVGNVPPGRVPKWVQITLALVIIVAYFGMAAYALYVVLFAGQGDTGSGFTNYLIARCSHGHQPPNFVTEFLKVVGGFILPQGYAAQADPQGD